MPSENKELTNKRILIVDDEEFILFLLQEELEEEGFVIDTALNGEICLEKIENFIYDLVILDINMPIMDGIDVLEKIKRKNDIPVIMHSAYIEDKGDYRLWAADAYCNKSVNLEELFSYIDKFTQQP